MTTAAAAREEQWERRFRWLPLGLLAIATIVAFSSGPFTGATAPQWRLAAQVVALMATVVLLSWRTVTRGTPGPRGRVAFYVVRTGLALTLTLLNPLFCIFAWIGFIDAEECFGPRAARGGLAATAVIMALGQSGGLPWQNAGQVALFGLLLVVNFGLSFTMARWAAHMSTTSEERAEAITELEQVNAELEKALQENAALQETVVEQARAAGVQDERQRLAREIHDGIAQSLAAVLSQLQAAQDETDPRRRIARATELAREALTEARRSMMDLSPAPLSTTGLPDALRRLVTDWDTDHEPTAHLVVTGEAIPLHPEVEAAVLRITQEALANVARHAGAHRVGVTLTYDEAEVILDVRDDGAGFDPHAARAPTSFGLRGMRQRAERLAGALAVEAKPGSGTAVSLRLPALVRGAA